MSEQDLRILLSANGFEKVELFILEISKYAPLNRQQYEAWNKSWPLSYREDTRLDPKFTVQDFEIIHKNMSDILKSNSVVCRIVDPSTDQVMAQECDTRDRHPLHHAVINSINSVAQKESELAGGIGRMKRPACQMTDEEIHQKTGYLCTGYDIYITHEPCAM